MQLGLRPRFRPLRMQTPITPIRLEFPGLDAVVQKIRQNFVDHLLTQWQRLHRERQFDASQKIARHPIGTGKIKIRLPIVLEEKNAAVLQESADNADYPNILAQPRNFGTQTANATHDEID